MEHDISGLRAAVDAGRVRSNFADSLLRQFDERGFLSEKQWFWVNKLASDEGRPVEQLPAFAGVLELFARARAHLKYPKIHLSFAGNPLRLHVAGERSKHAGAILLTDGTGFGGKFYGKVLPDGRAEIRVQPNRDELVKVLRSLAEHPAEVAAQYGHLTGNCCFCHKTLTDERSTSVGYGPVCAEHFGLPWGSVEKAA